MGSTTEVGRKATITSASKFQWVETNFVGNLKNQQGRIYYEFRGVKHN
jgi:hypothetical protein